MYKIINLPAFNVINEKTFMVIKFLIITIQITSNLLVPGNSCHIKSENSLMLIIKGVMINNVNSALWLSSDL